MKRALISVVALVAFTACHEILYIDPNDSIPEELAITSESDVEAAIRGCYDALQSENYYGRGLIIFNEIGSDNAYNGGTIIEFSQLNSYNVLADNTYLERIWSGPYIAINRCNTVLYHLTNTELNMAEERRAEYMAELLFIRALSYYNLTQLFKDIPLRLEPSFNANNLDMAKSSQNEVFTQIILDLKSANNVISHTNPHYITDLAVKTLLAKVCLFMGDYETAISYADTVIASDRRLLDNYEKIFTTEGGAESIFELRFTKLSSDRNRLAEYCYPTSLKGRYEIAPEQDLIESFEPNDSRLNLFLGSPYYCNKYENISGGDDNIHVFRLAELYLLRAEAKALAGGDIISICNDINAVRNRAGLDSIQSDSYSELLQIIELERRHEFAFEGHRWFDLVRTGRANQLLGIPVSKYYFPIPLSELNANSLISE
jgi:hypothetical protein